MRGETRTELPESSHVGKHLFDIHPDDSLGDFLDSIDDLVLALARAGTAGD
jgi:hypothetical protein